MLESLVLTQILAGTIILICALTSWTRRIMPVSTLNIFLMLNVVSFGVRPLLSAAEGGYIHYPVQLPWRDYNMALIGQIVFLLSYVLIYGMVAHQKNFLLGLDQQPFRICLGTILLAYALGTIALCTVHLLSHGAWLPGERTQTLSSVVPFGKVLFPLIDLPLSLVIPMSFSLLNEGVSKSQKRIAVVLASLSAVEIALVYQRGFLIYSIFVVLFMLHRARPQKFVKGLAISAVFTTVILLAMRPLVDLVTGSAEAPSNQGSGLLDDAKSGLLHSANFDLQDVAVLTREYVANHGVLYGQTFLTAVTRILPPATRNELNVETMTDRLNNYYWGDVYRESHIGLAVYLPHELYANFGFLGMFLGSISGYVASRADTYLMGIKQFDPRTIAILYAILFANGFMGEPAGSFQWCAAIFLLGLLFNRVQRKQENFCTHETSLVVRLGRNRGPEVDVA